MPSKYEVYTTIQDESNNNCDIEMYIANMESTIAVIVTHPWGPLGGNMCNNVVNTIVQYFHNQLHITTCRFNFNGYQLLSSGSYQIQQIISIAQHLLNPNNNSTLLQSTTTTNHENTTTVSQKQKQKQKQKIIIPKYILLIGYSYGSILASSASALLKECIGYISIAPPYGVSHWLYTFNQNTLYTQSSLRNEQYFKRLFIIGSNDNFTSITKFYSIINKYFNNNNNANNNYDIDDRKNNDNISTNTQSYVIDNVDHFFFRKEYEIINIIEQWLISTTGYGTYCNNDKNLVRTIDIDVSASIDENKQNDTVH